MVPVTRMSRLSEVYHAVAADLAFGLALGVAFGFAVELVLAVDWGFAEELEFGFSPASLRSEGGCLRCAVFRTGSLACVELLTLTVYQNTSLSNESHPQPTEQIPLFRPTLIL